MFMKMWRLKLQQQPLTLQRNLPAQVESQSPKGDFAVIGAVSTAIFRLHAITIGNHCAKHPPFLSKTSQIPENQA